LLQLDVTTICSAIFDIVHVLCTYLPLPASLALGAKHGKLDADLRTSALLGAPSVESIRDYYPFAPDDAGRLAPIAAELVDRMAVLVAVRRFPSMGVADSRSLRFDSYIRI
jgi:hypothetical protein